MENKRNTTPVKIGLGVQITLNKKAGICVIDSDCFNSGSRQTQLIEIR